MRTKESYELKQLKSKIKNYDTLLRAKVVSYYGVELSKLKVFTKIIDICNKNKDYELLLQIYNYVYKCLVAFLYDDLNEFKYTINILYMDLKHDSIEWVSGSPLANNFYTTNKDKTN